MLISFSWSFKDISVVIDDRIGSSAYGCTIHPRIRTNTNLHSHPMAAAAEAVGWLVATKCKKLCLLWFIETVKGVDIH